LSDDSDAGGVIAAVFEALESVEDQRDNFFRADVTDDSAHEWATLPLWAFRTRCTEEID
jgi:hypothetical protein